MGFLLTLTTAPETLDTGTAPPVDKDVLASNPFLNWTREQVVAWTDDNLEETALSIENYIILDQRTNDDATCLLITRKEFPEETEERLFVRSDFESSVVSLMTIEMGSGGADHLDTDYEGSDGVLRMAVRNRAEQAALEDRAQRDGDARG